MKIKEYEALTLKDGLLQVRDELGPDAVILETQAVRKGGVLGLGSREAVRIVAATGITVNDGPRPASRAGLAPAASAATGASSAFARQPRHESRDTADGRLRGIVSALRHQPVEETAPSNMDPEERRRRLQEALSEPIDPVASDRPRHAAAQYAAAAPGRLQAAVALPESETMRRMEREIGELKSALETMRYAVTAAPTAPAKVAVKTTEAAPSEYRDLDLRLREADVAEALAKDLLGALPDLSAWNPQAREHLAEAALHELMTDRVPVGGEIMLTPGKTKVVALIGPVGVGKTTTIAKLAAQFALVEKRKVGLLTLDTYRIAAVEQLKTYSQIISIPVKVVHSAAEIPAALAEFDGFDLVLIDTAGRSQKNVAQIAELKAAVEAAGCETHLVLGASTKEQDLRDQVQRFSQAGVDRLLFTKLDETTTYGTIFTIAAKHNLPVSYLTTGQKVPEDIEVATGSKLATFVLNSRVA